MKRFVILLMGIFCAISSGGCTPDSADLAGDWRFAVDPDDTGSQQQWYQKKLPGNDTVSLPGSMQEQDFGNNPSHSTPWVGNIRQEEWNKPKYAPYRSADNFKMPFWLQPDKYYKGAAWYQKTVDIPRSWKDKYITLTLERPHWETRVWVDLSAAGSANHLSVAHTYDLSNLLTPGEHTITIRVDNRMIINVGPNSHSVSDHTQSNWNGIVGKIELTAEDAAWIEDVQVYPDLADNTVKIKAGIRSHLKKSIKGKLDFEVLYDNKTVQSLNKTITVNPEGSTAEAVLELGDGVKTWDEFNPNLYTLKTQMKAGSAVDEQDTVFGMCQISLDGSRIILNGRRIFMRGTLECCIFPKTGYPPTDVASWKRIINVCKSHGLNHIRFHSWCPPEAAFIAADELGFYYQVECSSWANQGSSLGDGKPIDQWMYDEADAVLKAYGNHPSFMLFAYGNEPTGPENGGVYLAKWVSHYKKKDARRLVTGGSGWPMIKENEFHVTPNPRIQQWGQGLKSRINSKAPETVTDYSDYVKKYPNQSIISHEIGQWCVYPNFDEMKKYTGVLKAKNFEVFRDFLKQKHMLDQAHDFLMASGKLQTLCYKEDIESALRTPDFGGFQLLDLHDFPGQGTALVGVLDSFWDSKPYVSPAEYKRFSGTVVPLARLPKRIFTVSDTLTAQVDVSQFGPKDLTNVHLQWSLLDAAGKAVKRGVLQKDKLPAGDLYTVGHLSLELSDLPAPAKYRLELVIPQADAVNDWDVWVYPETVDTDAGDDVIITTALDENVVSKLQKGAKVLLVARQAQVKTDVKIGFSSIFWNTAWTGGQAPHTLGILCNPKHPALAQFPTEYHSNWQWSEPIQNAAAMVMDNLPVELRPIVQVVPDWFEPKQLGLVFEAKVGKGSLLVCSVNLQDNLQERPVARQLKHSLLAYMASDDFKPGVDVNPVSIRSLFREQSPMQKLGAKVIETDSFEPGHEGENAIDNDPATIWHTQWTGEQPVGPHEIHIDLGKPVQLKGLTYLPRQDGNQNGWVKGYAVYLNQHPEQWGEPATEGEFEETSAIKEVTFPDTVEARYIRFVAKSGFGDDVFTSAAEISVIIE
ncbi:MAG: discoidin domain-containing protein [Sedimentisphaerales bacterium]|nr:discoidin domain-containing protein [Sedimentisphaerales bacterium]